MVQALLCLNSLLPFLANHLNIQAFQDHKTIDDLFAVVPREDGLPVHIPWRNGLLNTPFFLSQSIGRDGFIETAAAFSKRFAHAGRRSECPEPPTMHDSRAYQLLRTGISVSSLGHSHGC